MESRTRFLSLTRAHMHSPTYTQHTLASLLMTNLSGVESGGSGSGIS